MSHGAGVTGGFAPPDINAGKPAQVLWKSSKQSYLLSLLYSLQTLLFLFCFVVVLRPGLPVALTGLELTT